MRSGIYAPSPYHRACGSPRSGLTVQRAVLSALNGELWVVRREAVQGVDWDGGAMGLAAPALGSSWMDLAPKIGFLKFCVSKWYDLSFQNWCCSWHIKLTPMWSAVNIPGFTNYFPCIRPGETVHMLGVCRSSHKHYWEPTQCRTCLKSTSRSTKQMCAPYKDFPRDLWRGRNYFQESANKLKPSLNCAAFMTL